MHFRAFIIALGALAVFGSAAFALMDARNAPLHKYGINLDVDTATDPEDVWSAGGVYPFPAAAAATTIKSTDVDDDGDPLDTGARTVTVFGLDSTYASITETATLNGTTAVTLANQYLRVHRAFVATAGSTGTNEGTITILHTATVIGEIPIGDGQTLMAIYTVPSDVRGALLRRFEFVGARGAGATTLTDVVLQARTFGGAWRTQHRVTLRMDNGIYPVLVQDYIFFPPRTDMRVRVLTVSGDNVEVSASFDLELVDINATHIPAPSDIQ